MNETWFKKQSERAKLKFQKLVSRPDFQADIQALRKKWRIPAIGLKTDKESEEWYRWRDEFNDQFEKNEWPALSRKLWRMREGIKTASDYRAFKEKEKEYNERFPINDYNKDIARLISKYKQSPRLEWMLTHYLLFNKAEMYGPIGVSVRITGGDGRRYGTGVSIGIEADTTLADIKAAWPMVKHAQKKLVTYKQKKFQPIQNFDRDQYAYELKLQGKTSTAIASILKKEYGGSLLYSDIPKLIKRHKKRLDIN